MTITERDKKGRIVKVSQFGKDNLMYKGDKCKHPRRCVYMPIMKTKKKICCVCNKIKSKKFITHHIDGDYKNNDPSNLAWICRGCHNKPHIRNPTGKNNCKRDSKGRFVGWK